MNSTRPSEKVHIKRNFTLNVFVLTRFHCNSYWGNVYITFHRTIADGSLQQCRTEFVKKVSGDNIPLNDVLIVGQSVSNGCVKTVMRTLGDNREHIHDHTLSIENLMMGHFQGRK